MRTTVIIPTFNRRALLEETFESIKKQSIPVHEIIVVDDGSEDDTPEFLAQIESEAKILRQKNAGKSAALNRALTEIQDGWVWIIDDDDLVPVNAHEVLLNLTKQGSDYPFVYGRHERFKATDDQNINLGTGYWPDCKHSPFLWETMNDMFAHQGAMLVDRKAFADVGPFNETLVRSQDYEMLLRLACLAPPNSTDEVVLFQRVHDGARGKSGDQFAADSSSARWQAADQTIFQELHKTWPLPRFSFDSTRPFRESEALIGRAIIMARKGLWKLAIADFHRAAEIDMADAKARELPIGFSKSIRGALSSKYGIDGLVNSIEYQDSIAALAKKSNLGRDVVQQLATGLRWRVKENLMSGRPITAAKTALLCIRWWRSSRGTSVEKNRA